MRLTLRTLLAYLDDTLPPGEARQIGRKLAESEQARELVDRIRKVTRRRGLSAPAAEAAGSPSDPNKVAEYLSDAMPPEEIGFFETTCLESDIHLAEVAACHQILTLLLSEPARVPPTARQRMYRLVKGPESIPGRKPGNTIPVGGLAADDHVPADDDQDAAYLLGLPAYSRRDPPNVRATRTAVAAALAAGLAAAVFFAWPRGVPDAHPVKANEFATLPPPPNDPLLKAADPQQKQADPPKKQPDPPQQKPAEDKKPDGPPAPKAERTPGGRLESPDAVVLFRGPDDRWLRPTKADPDLFTVDRLVALPGYKAKASVGDAVQLDLWGNLPDQKPDTPVLEAAVTLHPPEGGFDAELTVHTGRVYLTTKKPTAKVRLRTASAVSDLTLEGDKAEAAVEVTLSLVRGVTSDIDPKAPPAAAVAVHILRGKGTITPFGAAAVPLPQYAVAAWRTENGKLAGPTVEKLDKPADYFAKFAAAPDEAAARAAQQALADLAQTFGDPDRVKVKLAEMMGSDTDQPTLAVIQRCRVSTFASAALGDLPTVIDGLLDVRRPFVRDAAVYGLTELMPVIPDGPTEVRKLLADKCRLSDDDARLCVRLLRGPTSAERTDPNVIDRTVELLGSKSQPVVRELALWLLKHDIDPASRTIPALWRVDANAPADMLDKAKAEWKKRAEELKGKKN